MKRLRSHQDDDAVQGTLVVDEPGASPSGGTERKHVLLVPFDDIRRPVRVERTLLQRYDCMLWALVERQVPDYVDRELGYPAYNVPDASHELLSAFVCSLAAGELVWPPCLAPRELKRFFEFQGVSFPNGAIVANAPNLTDAPPCIGSHRARLNEASVVVADLCRVVTMAIVSWQRLYIAMERSKTGQEVHFDATTTRFLLQFARPPASSFLSSATQYRNGSALSRTELLAESQPRWLVRMLQTMGAFHFQMADKGGAFPCLTERAQYDALTRLLEEHELGWYCTALFDAQRNSATKAAALERGDDGLFYHTMKYARRFASTTLALAARTNAAAAASRQPATEAVDEMAPHAPALAGMCVCFCDKAHQALPNLARLFSNVCSAALPAAQSRKEDLTPARRELANHFKEHHIDIIEWLDSTKTCNPIVFPPQHCEENGRNGLRKHADGPVALFELKQPRRKAP